jgi:hypothetical protein
LKNGENDGVGLDPAADAELLTTQTTGGKRGTRMSDNTNRDGNAVDPDCCEERRPERPAAAGGSQPVGLDALAANVRRYWRAAQPPRQPGEGQLVGVPALVANVRYWWRERPALTAGAAAFACALAVAWVLTAFAGASDQDAIEAYFGYQVEGCEPLNGMDQDDYAGVAEASGMPYAGGVIYQCSRGQLITVRDGEVIDVGNVYGP